MVLLRSKTLPLGWEAKDFHLPNVDGREISLIEFADRRGLLIVFSCNHCPYAKAAWPLLVDLHKKFGSQIGFIAINPNDPQTYPEDSFEEMEKKAKEWSIPFPYLVDETQETARAYSAQCTPDPYLFKNEDGIFRLYYHGRICDNWQHPEQVKEKNLEQALTRLLDDQSSPENQPPSMGCSIKWRI